MSTRYEHMIDGFVYTDYAKGLLVFWFGGGGEGRRDECDESPEGMPDWPEGKEK